MFEGETKKMRERQKERCSYWNRVFTAQLWTITTHDKQVRKCLAKIDCHSLWPLPSQLGISLVKRQTHPRHLCLWASFAPIVWRNSRWGCRSVTLQQNWVSVFLCFFSLHPSLWTQYLWIGKTNMERGVNQHIRCQGLVRRALNLHHYSSSSGETVGLIQTMYTQLEERSGLSSGGK